MLFALVEYEYARVSMLGLVFQGEDVRVAFEAEYARVSDECAGVSMCG